MKRLLKALWRISGRVRRPFERRFEAFLATHLRPTERRVTDDTNMLMDHVIRELVRLQDELDALHQRLERLGVDQPTAARLEDRDQDRVEHLRAG